MNKYKKIILGISILLIFISGCGTGLGVDGSDPSPPDTTPPTILSVSPIDASTDNLVNTVLTFEFDMSMNVDTISTSNFSFKNADDEDVEGAVVFDSSTNTATFTPTSYLGNSDSVTTQTYTATVSKNVENANDIKMTEDYSWDFSMILASLWIKSFGGSESNIPTSMFQKSNGNYLVSGTTTGFGAVGNNEDIVLLEVDSTGVLQSSIRLNGTGDDFQYSLKSTNDGGYVLSGYTESYGVGARDAYAIKYDSDNNIEWQNTYGYADRDRAFQILEKTGGGYAIVGSRESGLDFLGLIVTPIANGFAGTGHYNSYGPTGGYETTLLSIAEDVDGSLLSCGRTNVLSGESDLVIIRTNSLGWKPALDLDYWYVTFDGGGDESAQSIIVADDGGYVVIGYTDSFGEGNRDIFVTKLNEKGVTPYWFKTYGTSINELGVDIRQTSDGGFIVLGWQYENEGSTVASVLMKIDSDGVIEWQKKYVGGGYVASTRVIQNSDGGFVVIASESLIETLTTDIVIMVLDENGEVHDQCDYTASVTLIENDQSISGTEVSMAADTTAGSESASGFSETNITMTDGTECSY